LRTNGFVLVNMPVTTVNKGTIATGRKLLHFSISRSNAVRGISPYKIIGISEQSGQATRECSNTNGIRGFKVSDGGCSGSIPAHPICRNGCITIVYNSAAT
jgi:hypothetical protein